MKKLIFFCVILFACTNKKERIAERQKQILEQKTTISKLLDAAKDSAIPTPSEFKKWDSLYHADDSLSQLYDSLEKEIKKY